MSPNTSIYPHSLPASSLPSCYQSFDVSPPLEQDEAFLWRRNRGGLPQLSCPGLTKGLRNQGFTKPVRFPNTWNNSVSTVSPSTLSPVLKPEMHHSVMCDFWDKPHVVKLTRLTTVLLLFRIIFYPPVRKYFYSINCGYISVHWLNMSPAHNRV